jgi:hypothetical protein
MIPMNDVVKVYKGEKRDSWGIVTTSTVPTELKGMVTYSTDIQELSTVDGEKVVVTANIVFKGKADISVKRKDKIGIIVDGTEQELKVLQVKPVKDLASVQIFTKVVV